MSQESHEFINSCRQHLEKSWSEITNVFESSEPPIPPLTDRSDLVSLINDCLTSSIKTYHYVLPTQLLAKAVNQDLDARSLQASHDAPGAFDARTVAHQVIVPFDQTNYRVLGGSPEPYVNNPVRVPAVIAEYRTQQRNKEDWDKLVTVLGAVEQANDPAFTQRVFEQVLFETYKLLAGVTVSYPTPNRISLSGVQNLIDSYLEATSGGERMEAICTALFQTIGEEFKVFDEAKREKVHAADASSGMLADIECYRDKRIVLLVEVKDRLLTLTQLDSKVDVARSRQIAELLFLARTGGEQTETAEIHDRIIAEFASGQNIYITNFTDFSLGIFILLGEKGRTKFINAIGQELNRVNAGIEHRRTWAQLLRNV